MIKADKMMTTANPMWLEFKGDKNLPLKPNEECNLQFAKPSNPEGTSTRLEKHEAGSTEPIALTVSNQDANGIYVTPRDKAVYACSLIPEPDPENVGKYEGAEEWTPLLCMDFMLGPVLFTLKQIDKQYTNIEIKFPYKVGEQTYLWDTYNVLFLGRGTESDKKQVTIAKAHKETAGHPIVFYPITYNAKEDWRDISRNHILLRKNTNGIYEYFRLAKIQIYHRLLGETVLLEDGTYLRFFNGPNISIRKEQLDTHRDELLKSQ